MNKPGLLLVGNRLALLLVLVGALSMTGPEADGQNFNAVSQPVMRYGGPLEKTLRIVPPLHRKLWPVAAFIRLSG